MTEHIVQVIQSYHMIEPGMRVIAGVSGGADSVCLLWVLCEYRRKVPFELLTVHVEHGLRGQESLDDAAFVGRLSADLGVPCRTVRAQVRETAQRLGISCEEAGRRERYRIFASVQKEWGADRIAVAHNRDDQAETVLWNLSRGSGVKGLAGMRPVRGDIIRPLLFTGRSEIEEILKKAGLSFRVDRTNLETEFTRNRLRLLILPQLEKEVNRQAARHIAQAADRLREVQEYVERKTEEAAARCLKKEGEEAGAVLLLDAFRKEDPLIQKELVLLALRLSGAGHEDGMLSPEGGMRDVGSVHIGQLLRLAEGSCGKRCDLPGGVHAVRERQSLRFYKDRAAMRTEPQRQPEALVLPVPGRVRWGGLSVATELLPNAPEVKKQILEEKKYTKWLSYDTIKSNVQLRTRRSGDYLTVNEEGGTKKLKDYFIDQKIPREDRGRIPLLADGSHILWVIGYRISASARVTQKTQQVIRIAVSSEST